MIVRIYGRWSPNADGSLDAGDAGGRMGVPDDGVEDAHERPVDVILGEFGLDAAEHVKVATSLLVDRSSEPSPARHALA